jgi:starch synthase
MGLDGILRKRSERLFGILNGVDYKDWNAETDKLITTNYSIKNLSGKETCKKDLVGQFGLPYVSGKPVVGMISRLDNQKGFDLIENALADLMIRDMQLVILGTGMQRFHEFFESVRDRYRGKLGVRLAYDNTLAHKIEAGSDIFLMPSRYEPCGLNQMYSLKYGTVPVARGTGGLDDTVFEWDGWRNGNGFKFYDYDYRKMLECLDKALKAYPDKVAWSKIMANGMAEDHSWGTSARCYIELYQKLQSY